MADKLQKAPSTVQGWKTAGRVPATEQPLVLTRADELGLDVTAVDVVFPLQARLPTGMNPYDASAQMVDCDHSAGSQGGGA